MLVVSLGQTLPGGRVWPSWPRETIMLESYVSQVARNGLRSFMCTYLLVTFSTGEVTFVLAISHTTQWGLCVCCVCIWRDRTAVLVVVAFISTLAIPSYTPIATYVEQTVPQLHRNLSTRALHFALCTNLVTKGLFNYVVYGNFFTYVLVSDKNGDFEGLKRTWGTSVTPIYCWL